MKARLILSLLMSSIMVLMVMLLVTAFAIMPGARRLADRIVARLEQTT